MISEPSAVPVSGLTRTGGGGWVWADGRPEIPPDAPLGALLAHAGRALGVVWAHAAQAAGLTPAGLGILRVLTVRDGLKSSEVAARGWSTPATVTSVTDTLVRDGYVERRRDETDRRVVRLFLTETGRRVCAAALAEVGPVMARGLDFVEPGDEPVIRKFLTATIMRFGELSEEEHT